MSQQSKQKESQQSKQTSNRKKLLIIFAWFFIPLVIAVALYAWYKLLPEGYRPTGTTNNGVLLDPAFRLSRFAHETKDGAIYWNKNVEKAWTLVQLIDGDCDEGCSLMLYNTRQMRLSMGKEIDRIDRIAVVSSGIDNESNLKMWDSHPDLLVLQATKNGIGAQIREQVKNIDYAPNGIFLIDPLGNVMMYFPDTLELGLIKKDLVKLLKLSNIG